MQQKTMTKEIPMLPLTSDIVFKRVFSREGNEKILKDLLEAILEIKIQKVVVKNPEVYINMGYEIEEEIATDDIEMHFIEIPKFIEKKPEVKNKLEQWLWLIVGEKEEIEMVKKENKEIENAMEIIKEMSMDPKEWEMYESRRLAIMDYNTGIHNSKERGKEEGKKEEKLSIAKKLLKRNMSIEDIIEITELTEEQILELKNI